MAQSVDDNEKRCLLTPTSLTSIPARVRSTNSENDLDVVAAALQQQQSIPLIYSEPALATTRLSEDMPIGIVPNAFSEAALQYVYVNDSGISSLEDNDTNANIDMIKKRAVFWPGATPKSSILLNDSRQSILTSASMNVRAGGHKQSFSTREIREQHMQIQKKYRPMRRRHFTDPVDFDGILNIIGGCSWWQIWVYLLISLQQIPHAMFNLSVVYMMYQPDHWCQVPGFNSTDNSTLLQIEDLMNTSVVFPRTRNNQRGGKDFHAQCHYYDRGEEFYAQLRTYTIAEAIQIAKNTTKAPIAKCERWGYAQDVMENTIVTEWSLVCDDNVKRAHAHMFYACGYLVGCLIGGYASDRFGRKPTIVGFGILSSMFGLILPYSTYFPMFLFLRFCGAVCNEAADIAAYVLCMEVTGTKYRAMVGSLLQAPWAVGYATLALVAYFSKTWERTQIITAGLHTVAVCLICVLPESPRWLIVNNRVEDAERYIRRACREPPFPFSFFKFNKSSLPCDLELVKHAEQRKWTKNAKRVNLMHYFQSGILCGRSCVISLIWIATALVYYGLVIALSETSSPGRALFSGNFFVNNAIAGAIELPTLLACVYLMKFGRKMSQMVTLLGTAVFCVAAMTFMKEGGDDNDQQTQVPALICMLFAKIFIQGAFNILYIFTSEMYPTVVRNTAVGFNSMIARIGSGLASYVAISADTTTQLVPMIIFGVSSLTAGLLVLVLPETKDQPLPDTLQDAVTFLKDKSKYQCFRKNGGTISANNLEDDMLDKDDLGLSVGGLDTADSEIDERDETYDTIRSMPSPTAIQERRMRHTAGTGGRKVSSEYLRQLSKNDSFTSKTSSILQDLADIQCPEKLTEPFDDEK